MRLSVISAFVTTSLWRRLPPRPILPKVSRFVSDKTLEVGVGGLGMRLDSVQFVIPAASASILRTGGVPGRWWPSPT